MAAHSSRSASRTGSVGCDAAIGPQEVLDEELQLPGQLLDVEGDAVGRIVVGTRAPRRAAAAGDEPHRLAVASAVLGAVARRGAPAASRRRGPPGRGCPGRRRGEAGAAPAAAPGAAARATRTNGSVAYVDRPGVHGEHDRRRAVGDQPEVAPVRGVAGERDDPLDACRRFRRRDIRRRARRDRWPPADDSIRVPRLGGTNGATCRPSPRGRGAPAPARGRPRTASRTLNPAGTRAVGDDAADHFGALADVTSSQQHRCPRPGQTMAMRPVAAIERPPFGLSQGLRRAQIVARRADIVEGRRARCGRGPQPGAAAIRRGYRPSANPPAIAG